MKNINDYWIVEFNEGKHKYAGRILDKNLIDKLKEEDESRHIYNSLYDNRIDKPNYELLGYDKFYFDHIVNGKVVEHLRIDIGDGNMANEEEFNYLYEQITPNILKQ